MSLLILSECGKMRTRITLNTDTFLRSVLILLTESFNFLTGKKVLIIFMLANRLLFSTKRLRISLKILFRTKQSLVTGKFYISDGMSAI